ncbi:hypothetical protein [Nocardioides sp. ChNu-99]|uniref:hypothetical protein n=1 Tax=Nocardioides sp. ChNu-99 TaxID=2839897 RepID=UPI0024054899|nr:hypothetical protein [Nocardioides sp. ChNu-99]MDF9714717.1 hypothetical protein [Nocardioides sp. ChNu-99]
MTWNSYHRRGEVLAAVAATADARRDGLLPTDVAGVAETFRDDLDLLGALQLRWHTRLAGRIDRELSGQPLDLEAAVVAAWVATARDLAGVRMVLDRATTEGAGEEADRMLGIAVTKERLVLAAMAGRSSFDDAASAAVGAAIEDRARATLAAEAAATPRVGAHAAGPRPTLLDRLRAALAA